MTRHHSDKSGLPPSEWHTRSPTSLSKAAFRPATGIPGSAGSEAELPTVLVIGDHEAQRFVHDEGLCVLAPGVDVDGPLAEVGAGGAQPARFGDDLLDPQGRVVDLDLGHHGA